MNYLDGARRVSLLLLLAGGVSLAQVYPPGGYPPGGYPPGYPGGYPYPRPTGTGIPMPGGRSKGKPDTSTKGQPLPNFRGKLKQMDAKQIMLALDDDRTMIFKRNDKTKFFKNGDEIKDPKFNEGDQISIEGPEDSTGNMVAVNVYWEKGSAATQTASNGKDDGAVVDTWKDAPKDAKADGAAPPVERATTEAPAPSRASDDPGRPKLQRGKVADPSREHATDQPPQQQAEAVAPPPSIARDAANPAGALPPPGSRPESAAPVYREADDDSPSLIARQGDDLIRKATDAALDFTETLPNYVCTEMIARYQSETTRPNWQPIDVVSAEVIYENHKESYRNLTRNGKKIDKKMEELDGAWSTGEFGSQLIDLFSPATAATFRYKKDARSSGVATKVYDFDVDHKHSHWNISVGGQSYLPAFRGSVWIDPATSRVLRIEMQAYGFPSEFPDDHVESATDYEYTRLGDAKQYLLPVHSENLACQRGTNMCSRNAIDFRNYHKYTGESTITFGKEK
jgi:hypothetical protein